MQSSPKGREIEYVEGSPDGIIERGNAITTLGDQMLESADVLENIKNRAIESGSQKGMAIEALREAIGDSYATLREAGELYQPVGPVIATYGEALDAVQPLIKSAVDDSQELWNTYVLLPGDVEPRGTGGWLQPDEGSPEAEQQGEEDAAKKAAYDAWEERAGDFDAHYDTWEDAFDTAVENIGDKMAGSIKDSFWSDFADILGKVALVLAIAAIIIGGPILAALAALAAVLYLVAVIGQYQNGEADRDDIVLAALGVIPIGKLSNLTKLMHGTKGLSIFGKGALGNFGKLNGLFSKPTLGSSSLIKLFRTDGAGAAFRQLAFGTTGLKATRADHLRAFMGSADDLRNGLSRFRTIVKLDAGLTGLGRLNDFNSWSDKAGGPAVTLPSWSGALI